MAERGGRYSGHLGSSGSLLSFRGSGGLSPRPGSATDPTWPWARCLACLQFRRSAHVLSWLPGRSEDQVAGGPGHRRAVWCSERQVKPGFPFYGTGDKGWEMPRNVLQGEQHGGVSCRENEMMPARQVLGRWLLSFAIMCFKEPEGLLTFQRSSKPGLGSDNLGLYLISAS